MATALLRSIIWTFVLACQLPAGAPGVKAQLLGGTLPLFQERSDIRLNFTGPDALALVIRKTELRIPYGKVNTLEYGQNVSRRYAAAVLISPFLLLSKTRKHFVTLGYEDQEGAQQVLVFRVDKNDIRAVLAGLEARTGRRIEFQDDEARKSVR